MMKERVRSPPPRHGRRYLHRSPDNRLHGRYSPRHELRNRRVIDDSRERKDFARNLVEYPRCDEDLGRNDTTSMKFQWNHLLGHSRNDSTLCSRMDEDRNTLITQSWKESEYQTKHGLGESKRISNNLIHGTKNVEYGGGSGGLKGNNESDYEDSRFEGVGSSRMMGEKVVYPKTDLIYPTSDPQSGNKRSYLEVGGGGSYSPSKKISGELHKNEELRLQDRLSREIYYGDRPKSYSREGEIARLYLKNEKTQFYSREEENPRLYSREEKPYLHYRHREPQFFLEDSLHHKRPISQHKNSLPVGSDAYNRMSHYLTGPYPSETLKPLIGDTANYRKNKLSPNARSLIDYGYSTARESDYTEMGLLADKPYGTLSFAKDDYPLGSRVMDPLLDGYSSRREHLTEERLKDDRRSRSPLEQLASHYLDAPRSSYANRSNVEGLVRRDMDLGYEAEFYRIHENTSSREDYGYRRDEAIQPRDERTNSYLRENYGYGRVASPRKQRVNGYVLKDYDRIYDRVDQIFDEEYYDPLEGVEAADVGMLTQPKDVPKRRRDISERLSINKNSSREDRYDRPNKSLLRGPRLRNPWVSNEIVRPGKARVLNRVRDIKKRLGPARPDEHVAVRPSVKKQMTRKLSRKGEDGDGDGSVQAEEESPREHCFETVKSEPNEKSEEFKQLVRSAFFKYVKQLNEDTVELGKIKEQGKTGSLKCWVCGSGSEEFPDTESLVEHACTATRVGFRAQHFGFHKALCAMIGWKAAEKYKDEWSREVLSVAEIALLKEDLILWPPVVVVHNSSTRKKNPDGQVVVSVEGLQTMIKENGFGEKTKVCLGKPVNQSILVVKFSATYSGYQEAERLHKHFADQKHGRTEFMKAYLKSPVESNDTQKALANNMQDVLYGFLGIGSDYNKLDSETKKRCVVRSKKEIQDLGDTPLKAE